MAETLTVPRPADTRSTVAAARTLTGIGCAVLAVAATTIAAAAASQVAVPVASDAGLVALLPAAYWAGPITLNVVFALIIRTVHRHTWLMTLLLCCLVLTLYGPAALASGHPRSEVSFRHLGVIDTMLGAGSIDPMIDAYFNWPGFFGGAGLVMQATGVSPLALAVSAPVLTMLLWLAALALVVRAFTPDARIRWLTLWLFCLGNWIDQDYLSPQAFAFFLHLVILGLVLNWLGARPAVRLRTVGMESGVVAGVRRWWTSRTPVEPDKGGGCWGRLRPDPNRRCTALLIVVLLGSVMIISHQLTPFAMLLSVTTLTLTGRSWSPWLPVILALIAVVWLTYGASTYLEGHPILFRVEPESVASSNLTGRLDGGPGHLVVIVVRMGLTAAIWVLAVIGALRWMWRENDLRPVLLAVVPLVLVPVQAYGGEMLLRVSLFALPFTAFLAANAFTHGSTRTRRGDAARIVAVAAVGIMLAVAMVTARFGNARFDMFSASEIEAGEVLYRVAPPDALLVAAAHPTPWRYRDYTRKYVTFQDLCRPDDHAAECFDHIRLRARHKGKGAAVLLARSHRESLRLQGLMRMETVDKVEELLRNARGAQLVYMNGDARIYLLPPEPGRRRP